MEAAPPSYEKATLIDHWDIIAKYLPSNDLCSASLVCGRWHATFAPYLWGNPASHFGLENDRVYVALTKFKRTLRTARLLVRSMTHTLHLPPAHAELYYGPHADWLRDTLDRLPNLQSLIVRSLPFFDHAALQRLKQPDTRQVGNESGLSAVDGVIELPGSVGTAFERPAGMVPSFGLRLLDASRCSNVTSHGLALALERFENLMYLDLSFTSAAREANVLSALRHLAGMQVLKLRGIRLKDDNLELLAKHIGRRVRSLDLRDNNITDRGVRALIEHCFVLSGDGGSRAFLSRRHSPALLSYLGSEMLQTYQGEDFEGYLRGIFTGRFVGRLAIEDVPEGGITHLYMANNDITVEAVSGLLRCKRLHVLDVGSLSSELFRHPIISPDLTEDQDLQLPGMEKLIGVLSSHASETVSFLRIDHSLVTKEVLKDTQLDSNPGRVELADTALLELPPGTERNVVEMATQEAAGPAFEMSAEPSTPRAELIGDPIGFVISPPEHTTCEPGEKGVTADGPRRGSASAAETTETLSSNSGTMSPLSRTTTGEECVGTTMSATGGVSLTDSTAENPTAPPIQSPHLGVRPRSYSSVGKYREIRLQAHVARDHSLHPAMLPKLRTLILTNVPASSSTKDDSQRLIDFVSLCAEEAQLALTQAKYDYSLPPGRGGQAAALRQSAEKHFALKRLVLEIAPEDQLRRSSKASHWQHTTGKSMTQDRDSEALWNAAETDFSFFGDEEEMFPSIEMGPSSRYSNEKEVSMDAGRRPSVRKPLASAKQVPQFDNMALLAAFRQDRRLAHQRTTTGSAAELGTQGYWDGLIQVSRPRPGQTIREDEELDYYGNAFSDGYLYR